MQRRVVDSNYLRNSDLQVYLARSPSNYVVLTDFIAMEVHKKNALLTAPKSFEILGRFPRQVLVTKKADDILRVSPRGAGLARRLIDQGQTKSFSVYCGLLRDLDMRPDHRRLVETNEAASARHMSKALSESAHLPKLFAHTASQFTPDELLTLRRREPYSRATQWKLADVMFDTARKVHSSLDIDRRYIPSTNIEALNTFVFRYSLCWTLLYTRWVVGGQQRAVKAEKLRNDLVDMNTSAMGTFFDGVLSKDQKLVEIHREARWILAQMGAYLGSGRAPRIP